MRQIFCGVLLLSALTGSCTGEKDFLDQLFNDYSGDQLPGAVVMVVSRGQIIEARAYGMADIEKQIAITPAHNFRLASVSKQFNSACILRLIAAGKLTLQTTLRDLFPEFPAYGDSITIHNLLQHTSGLVDYESLIPDTATIQVLDADVLALMMTQDTTYFRPGSEYRYSNSGYALLAMTVEKCSGMSYPDFLQQEIFGPLGMDNTLAYLKGVNEVPTRAYGYTIDENGRAIASDQSLTSAVLGDGGIYSSLLDLYKWDQALYQDEPLNDLQKNLMWTPQVDIYGYGWRIDEYKGRRRVHHGGSTRGFRNILQRFPDDEFTVIILSNRSEPDVTPLASRIADHYLFQEGS